MSPGTLVRVNASGPAHFYNASGVVIETPHSALHGYKPIAPDEWYIRLDRSPGAEFIFDEFELDVLTKM